MTSTSSDSVWRLALDVVKTILSFLWVICLFSLLAFMAVSFAAFLVMLLLQAVWGVDIPWWNR